MKKFIKIYILLLFVLVSQIVVAQQIGNLEGINYQAVAIDEKGKEIVGIDVNGKPLHEKTIGVRFTILSGESGPVLYQETHTALTDQHGLFSLVIGLGDETSAGQYSNLMDIPWIDANQHLKVELAINNDGNYRLVSLQKFMTVPYSFYTDDIADNAITTNKILNETILEEDIATGAVTTSEILDRTILEEDIALNAVTTSEIMNESILNEDIANSTLDLTQKVTGILPVSNGGTGLDLVAQGDIVIGSGSGALNALAVNDSVMLFSNKGGNTELFKLRPGARTSITVDETTKTITITALEQAGGPGTGTGQVSVGVLAPGEQQLRNFPASGVSPGDIILATIDQDLQGITLTAYVRQEGQVILVFFNGSGSTISLGNVDVNFANFGQP
jgi:adenosylcobinamide amidohydrolase